MNESQEENGSFEIEAEFKLPLINTLALLLNSRVSRTLTGEQITNLELLESIKNARHKLVLEEIVGEDKIVATITFDEEGVHRIDFKKHFVGF